MNQVFPIESIFRKKNFLLVFAKNHQKTHFHKNQLQTKLHFEPTIILSFLILNTAVKILSYCGAFDLNLKPFHIFLKFRRARLCNKTFNSKLFFHNEKLSKRIEFHISYSVEHILSFISQISYTYFRL